MLLDLAQVQHKAHLKQLADCHYASVLKVCVCVCVCVPM